MESKEHTPNQDSLENRLESAKNPEENTTNIVSMCCDQGHYGMRQCGNCYTILDDSKSYEACPKCNYTFTGTSMKYHAGGSDF